MIILYYFYSNNQGENKPQNSPTLESATFDYPLAFILTWIVQLAADWVQFSSQGRRQKGQQLAAWTLSWRLSVNIILQKRMK